METGDILRGLLVVSIAGMAGMALAYLRRRQMSGQEYLAWGLLAVCLPVLGPFLVIARRPGHSRSARGVPGLLEERSLAQMVARWRQRATRQQ